MILSHLVIVQCDEPGRLSGVSQVSSSFHLWCWIHKQKKREQRGDYAQGVTITLKVLFFISSFRTHFHGCNQLIRSLKDTVFHCVHRRQWCGWIMTQSLPQILTHAQFLCYFILCYFSLTISDYKAPNQPFIIGNYSGGLLLLWLLLKTLSLYIYI